eukprot:scaffold7375_cov268-Pinguiococcus_pyrenoidosus.AAC.17
MRALKDVRDEAPPPAPAVEEASWQGPTQSKGRTRGQEDKRERKSSRREPQVQGLLAKKDRLLSLVSACATTPLPSGGSPAVGAPPLAASGRASESAADEGVRGASPHSSGARASSFERVRFASRCAAQIPAKSG